MYPITAYIVDDELTWNDFNKKEKHFSGSRIRFAQGP